MTWSAESKRQGWRSRQLSARIHHDPMQTRQKFLDRNAQTWKANEARLNEKIANDDYSAHGWSLETRRANRWD
jgi:hypothetical protein